MAKTMTGWEFVDLADELVHRLGERIPERELRDLEDDIADWIQVPDIFIRQLAHLLAEAHVPMSQSEAELTVRLLEEMSEDTAIASRFNIVADHPRGDDASEG